jgi:hypothetical protein
MMLTDNLKRHLRNLPLILTMMMRDALYLNEHGMTIQDDERRTGMRKALMEARKNLQGLTRLIDELLNKEEFWDKGMLLKMTESKYWNKSIVNNAHAITVERAGVEGLK